MLCAARSTTPFCLLAVCAACAPTPSPRPVAEVTVDPIAAPSASAGAAPSSSSAAVPPSLLEGWTVPVPMGPMLGDACETNPKRQQPRPKALGPPATFDPVCGTRGRVSMEMSYSAFRTSDPAPPCKLDVLPFSETIRSYRRSLCISGDHMLLESACVECRVMDAGTIAHVRLSELTAEQHASLAATMMFEPGSGPKTPDDWRALARSAQSP